MFVENSFADCKVYICVSAGRAANAYWLNPDYTHENGRAAVYGFDSWWRRPFTLVLAEKSATSTSTRAPVQGHYRSQLDWPAYLDKLAPIRASMRPHLARSIRTLLPRLARRGFTWMDHEFKPRPLKPSLPRRALREWYK
jgi:hypothetical protein